MQLSQTYTEAHSDDITALSFHPSPALPHVLLSASVDGLVNTYDIRIVDEDDALLSTAQFGSSVASAGWMALEGAKAGELKGVWGATTIETVQIWDAEEVRLVLLSFSPFEADMVAFHRMQSELVADLGDIREVCLEPWRSDYLISVHYNSALGGLCILTGTQKFVFPSGLLPAKVRGLTMSTQRRRRHHQPERSRSMGVGASPRWCWGEDFGRAGTCGYRAVRAPRHTGEPPPPPSFCSCLAGADGRVWDPGRHRRLLRVERMAGCVYGNYRISAHEASPPLNIRTPLFSSRRSSRTHISATPSPALPLPLTPPYTLVHLNHPTYSRSHKPNRRKKDATPTPLSL